MLSFINAHLKLLNVLISPARCRCPFSCSSSHVPEWENNDGNIYFDFVESISKRYYLEKDFVASYQKPYWCIAFRYRKDMRRTERYRLWFCCEIRGTKRKIWKEDQGEIHKLTRTKGMQNQPVSQSAAWGSSLPAVEQVSIMSFILPVTSFSILRAMVKASPTPAHVYVFSFGSMGVEPKKSLFVAPLQCWYSIFLCIPMRYMFPPHPQVFDKLLGVISFLISVTPEEGGHLWQVHRVLKKDKANWRRKALFKKKHFFSFCAK